MARVAVLDPDDDPRSEPFRVTAAGRQAFLASLTGLRLAVRADGDDLLARIDGSRIARVRSWLRDRLARL